jgi:hypothetical protein
MMNEIDKIKYTQLLDLEWTVKKATRPAQAKYDEYYQKYGKHDKKDLLTELAYKDLKELRDATKTIKIVIDTLRQNDLYTNGA